MKLKRADEHKEDSDGSDEHFRYVYSNETSLERKNHEKKMRATVRRTFLIQVLVYISLQVRRAHETHVHSSEITRLQKFKTFDSEEINQPILPRLLTASFIIKHI